MDDVDGALAPGIVLLLGGARSGKSRAAVELAGRHPGPVTFVATATALDDDMAVRIARHRDERPPAWATVEEPTELVAALDAVPADHLVVVDCLTLWVSNLMFAGVGDEAIESRAVELAARLAARPAPSLVVTNEVGAGIHPPDELSRRYRDALGRVNQRVAAAARRAVLLVAGRAVPLQDPWEVIR